MTRPSEALLAAKTPADIYALPALKTGSLDHLCGTYFDHVPEIGDLRWGNEHKVIEGVEVRVHAEFWMDCIRRFWRLASVWHHGKPVMVIQNAGREGDDHSARFVTDRAEYRAMVTTIFAALESEEDAFEEVPVDEEIRDLIVFYGATPLHAWANAVEAGAEGMGT